MAARLGISLGPRFEHLDRLIEQKFTSVAEGIRVATAKLTAPCDDRPIPRVGPRDEVSGELHRLVDHAIEERFARYPPMGSAFRYLVTLQRVVPEIERSGDLVDLIAERAGLSRELPPSVAACFSHMGEIAAAMWDAAGMAWVEIDPKAADHLDDRDDEMDLLTAGLPALLTREAVATRAAIELTLVGRFFERLGDHAVHIASRIRWLAGGS